MRIPGIFLSIFCLLAPGLFAQQEGEEVKRRREIFEDILRMQDLRSPHDSRLIRYLSDSDPLVRERATLAFGSTQDTTQIGLITRNLADPSPAVQFAAAFALGQIGTQLGVRGRQDLEYDLIWKRLEQTAAASRLVEEIGKFGTETALNDLVLRVGGKAPTQYNPSLAMSIARFALRGTVSASGLEYLLRFAEPAESMPWEVSYALQRIGRHPLVRVQLDRLSTGWKHNDPLVRMNIALLFGKFPEELALVGPLENLARYDQDWRVRVNAFRSLGNFPSAPSPSVVDAFRQAFFDASEHVATTALASFPGTGVSQTDSSAGVEQALRELRLLAENRSGNFHWQIQAEAANALARISGSGSLPYIHAEQPTQPPLLQAQLLRALGQAGSTAGMGVLEQSISSEDPSIVCAALQGMSSVAAQNRGDSAAVAIAYGSALKLLETRDVAIVATAALLLGDSLFLRPASVGPLLETLADLRVADHLEAMLEICSTLGKLRDARAAALLRKYLDQPDRALALAAAGALRAITGIDYTAEITTTMEPWYVDFDFAYLRSLPDTVIVQLETIRGEIVLELYKNLAPFTVMNILKLAEQRGFYRGLSFHRVVPNFVIQGGDPRRDGWGGPGWTIRSEFTPLSYTTGAVGIASAGKDTEGCQFFITHSPQPHLDGRYTLFGRVRSGQSVVDRIQVDDHILDFRILGR
jgi:cyclophilin family peptidyl-prolyl cis-trans isomerase